MKETFLHTGDRQKKSDAMVKEVGGSKAKESHLRWIEAKKAVMGCKCRREHRGQYI